MSLLTLTSLSCHIIPFLARVTSLSPCLRPDDERLLLRWISHLNEDSVSLLLQILAVNSFNEAHMLHRNGTRVINRASLIHGEAPQTSASVSGIESTDKSKNGVRGVPLALVG
jgi:hypothetical protein